MAVVTGPPHLKPTLPDGALELDLRPLQGLWTEEQCLKLSEQTNHLLEFSDGVIEMLPMLARQHQAISRFLFLALLAFVQGIGGTVFYAPLRLQIRPGKYREPDLLLLRSAGDPCKQDAFWLGADLVVEIVSPDDPERDTKIKRADYAAAGIPEYWIVNPQDETITILSLAGEKDREAGVYRRGDTVASLVLAGFRVSVDAVLEAQ